MLTDKELEEISEIIYKVFEDAQKLDELEKLLSFIFLNIPPKDPQKN